MRTSPYLITAAHPVTPAEKKVELQTRRAYSRNPEPPPRVKPPSFAQGCAHPAVPPGPPVAHALIPSLRVPGPPPVLMDQPLETEEESAPISYGDMRITADRRIGPCLFWVRHAPRQPRSRCALYPAATPFAGGARRVCGLQRAGLLCAVLCSAARRRGAAAAGGLVAGTGVGARTTRRAYPAISSTAHCTPPPAA